MNFEELESALLESLTWRKHELQQAQFLAEQADENSRPYLCRAWILVMYAHCDQYTKEASRLYLEHLRNTLPHSYDYWSIWQAFRAKELILNGSDGTKYESALRPQNNDKSMLIDAIAHKTVLDSGNFCYKRLRFIVDFVIQAEFDCVSYKAFCSTLKTKRDEIAHGEHSFVSKVDDCIAWHEPTLRLLDGFSEMVLRKANENQSGTPS